VGRVAFAEPCGDVDYFGRCEAGGQVVTWCEGGSLQHIDCAKNLVKAKTCGYNVALCVLDCVEKAGDVDGCTLDGGAQSPLEIPAPADVSAGTGPSPAQVSSGCVASPRGPSSHASPFAAITLLVSCAIASARRSPRPRAV